MVEYKSCEDFLHKRRDEPSMKPNYNTYAHGLTDGIAIALGYLAVSFSVGIQASAVGIPVFWAVIISMTNLTSAGQAAGIGIIGAGGSLIEIAAAQLTINSRYFLMSLSLSQRLDGKYRAIHRILSSFGITDEIFAVASAKPFAVKPAYMYGLITLPYVGWAVGTLLGALAGSLLPDIVTSALGVMLYGMFIAIVLPPAKKDPRLLCVILPAIAVSCIIYYLPALDFISGGFSVIISTVIASVIGALLFPIETEDPEDE